MTVPEQLLLAGNVVMFVGTVLLIRTVWHNRTLLYGYDLMGSVLTLCGLLFFYAFYVVAQQWLSCAFATVTTLYWLLVVVFKVTQRDKS